MHHIYLDHAATTPTDERVLKQMFPYFQTNFGNASSLYHLGQKSFSAISDAREQIAQTLNARAEEIIFTSGGTEADNLAVIGAAQAHCNHRKHIVTTQIEHPAVKQTFAYLEELGFEATYVPVSKSGQVCPATIEEAIRPDTILVSVLRKSDKSSIHMVPCFTPMQYKHFAAFRLTFHEWELTCCLFQDIKFMVLKESVHCMSKMGSYLIHCCMVGCRKSGNEPGQKMSQPLLGWDTLPN